MIFVAGDNRWESEYGRGVFDFGQNQNPELAKLANFFRVFGLNDKCVGHRRIRSVGALLRVDDHVEEAVYFLVFNHREIDGKQPLRFVFESELEILSPWSLKEIV